MSKNTRNIIKWHYVTDLKGKPTGLRGWDPANHVRYEMTYRHNEGWRVCIVDFGEFDGLSDFNHVNYRHIASGSLFECMQAAENDADETHAD